VQVDPFLEIREGMTVEDADGDTIGKVVAIYRPAQVGGSGASASSPGSEACIKVHSGLPLIGRTLYVPSSAVREIVDDRVILVEDESRVEDLGWEERPAWLTE
jgi:hypothetical protein